MHQERRGERPGERVVRGGLTPDLDARSVEIAVWMFDAATCGVMSLATAPTVSAEALHELKMLLAAVRDVSYRRPEGISSRVD